MANRNWMKSSRLSREYNIGLREFSEFAKAYCEKQQKNVVRCPCIKCGNGNMVVIAEMERHLRLHGIDASYTVWYLHGEPFGGTSQPVEVDNIDENVNDVYQDDDFSTMLNDRLAADNEENAELFEVVRNDADTPLYQGCTRFSKLSAVLKLYNLKAKYGWSDKSFTDLLSLLGEMLLQPNELPRRTYDAKKILCPMGIEYKKIHACPNDCVLYRGAYENMTECPKCGALRHKQKTVNGEKVTCGPVKVLWYLPVIPRFKRMFANSGESGLLVWHSEKRVEDENMRHPADSKQWKEFDVRYPEFGKESRNLRLALSTDGMNPFGNMSSRHSTWPVLIVLYNLSPSLCMKRKYMMLTLMISGPKQPGNDIDVYLAPLIDDLKMLWERGVEAYDAHKNESFTMRAMLFCTINDFPAYGNLSGYSVKGYKACPICEDETDSTRMSHCRKIIYTGHRRFLPHSHPYRGKKAQFNGSTEHRHAPEPLTGADVLLKIQDIEVSFGKTMKSSSNDGPWKKKSIFFTLPYWSTLQVRHCIDVMHLEKNVAESLIGTLLDIKGKSKDGLATRLDLAEMGIRKELAPQVIGNRTFLPPASYTLSRRERESFCKCLHDLKVPYGYSSNIRSLVSMKDTKIMGMKSHDCHVLMQQLLPIAIRGVLPKKVRLTITKLCAAFSSICSKVISRDSLDSLQEHIVLTLCELEMYFPPSFFDIMVHLLVHVVREIRECGPVHMRWMYPFERCMKVMKGYVRNRFRPEGCMVEGYIAEESVEFCTTYLGNTDAIGVFVPRLLKNVEGCGHIGQEVKHPRNQDLLMAHFYILNNLEIMIPFVEEHLNLLRSERRNGADHWVQNEHKRRFSGWFSHRIVSHLHTDKKSVDQQLRWLGRGVPLQVLSYRGYDINGYSFYTREQDSRSVMQNSGVTLASVEDQSYFGIVEEIWELDYTHMRIPVFKCWWADNRYIRDDEFGFKLINNKRQGYKDDPFILAEQAKQIFYVTDPIDPSYSIVVNGKQQHMPEESVIDDDIVPLICRVPSSDTIINDVDAYCQRTDHSEGIWIQT